jgi:hypothetical protein
MGALIGRTTDVIVDIRFYNVLRIIHLESRSKRRSKGQSK